MRNHFRLIRMFLIVVILFLQFNIATSSSNKIYAIKNNETSNFTLHTDTNKVNINENVVLKILNTNKEDNIVKIPLPEGSVFNEDNTKELNLDNNSIQKISIVENNILQIERAKNSDFIGEVKLSVKLDKIGDYHFLASSIRQGYTVTVESPEVSVTDNTMNTGNPQNNTDIVSVGSNVIEGIDGIKKLSTEDNVNEGTSVLEYPNIKIADESHYINSEKFIPNIYNFRPQWSSLVTYEVNGGKYTKDTENGYKGRMYHFAEGSDNKQHYVLIKKAARYQEEWVDIRINVLSTDGYVDIAIPDETDDFWTSWMSEVIAMSNDQSKILYEFFKHNTDEPIKVTGAWEWNAGNLLEGTTGDSIQVRKGNGYLTDLYTHKQQEAKYQEINSNTVQFNYDSSSNRTNSIAIAFNSVDFPITFLKGKSAFSPRLSMLKREITRPIVIGDVEDDSRMPSYHVYQETNSSYAGTISISSPIMKGLKVKRVTVRDTHTNKDFTNEFDISISDSIVQAISKSNFINDAKYDMEIQTEIISFVDIMSYYENGYLKIPIHGEVDIENHTGSIKLKNEGIAKIRFRGIPAGKPVPQTVAVGTDLRQMDISTFVTDLSVDTNHEDDKPISVVGLEDIPDTNIVGEHTVKVVIETRKGMQARIEVPVTVMEGTLKFVDAPRTISFGNLSIPSQRTIYKPVSISNPLKIKDGRLQKQKWYIYVKETQSLTSDKNDQLVGAMSYIKNGVTTPLSKENIEAFSQTSENAEEVILDWTENEGIRLQITPDRILK